MITETRVPSFDEAKSLMEPAIAKTLRLKAERRGVITHQPLSVGEFEGRLRAFIASRLDGEFQISGVARLAGGASKEQFVFNLDRTEDGETRSDRLVLRMDPPGSMVETSRLREFELLRSLKGVLPVPEVHWVTEDPEELGGPAMVCGFVLGTSTASEGKENASGLGATYGARLRGILGPQFVEYLAALHTHDWKAEDLPSFRAPKPGTTEAVTWHLAALDCAWAQHSFEPHPTLVLAREWLWMNRPVVDHVSVIHGDYRNGNFLFDEGTGKITSVLDWERAYLGDRHHDLAYALTTSWGEYDDITGDFYASALVEQQAFLDRYQELTGLPVDPERLNYYQALNLYGSIVALIATGPRNAADQMTHLDVMQNFLAGLGTRFLSELHDIVTRPWPLSGQTERNDP